MGRLKLNLSSRLDGHLALSTLQTPKGLA